MSFQTVCSKPLWIKKWKEILGLSCEKKQHSNFQNASQIRTCTWFFHPNVLHLWELLISTWGFMFVLSLFCSCRKLPGYCLGTDTEHLANVSVSLFKIIEARNRGGISLLSEDKFIDLVWNVAHHSEVAWVLEPLHHPTSLNVTFNCCCHSIKVLLLGKRCLYSLI